MMSEFRMPSLGADMDHGTIVEWRVRPGDRVHRGDIVAVVDTDKSDIEVEIFEDGIIDELLVEPGHTVDVGTALARVRATDAESKPHAEPTLPPEPSPPTPARAHGRVRASPHARTLATARGIDLGSLTGTGPGGAVLAADLDRRSEAVPTRPATAAPAPRTAARPSAARQATAALMARSKREIPHYYLATTVELDPALTWLREHNASRTPDRRILPAALLLRSIALAARDHPTMNGFWMNDDLQSSAAVHLGIAISLRGGGLVAPAIRDADQLGVDDLMAAVADIVTRARAGTLRSSEMSSPTITVTNLGDQGVEEVYGVIYPPQVALVGCGRIVERPVACNGLLGVRPVMRLTLSADHRASDGHQGARFLNSIAQLLQQPEAL